MGPVFGVIPRVTASLLLLMALSLVSPGVADAASTCVFDSASATATVDADPNVETNISRSGTAIQVDGVDCPGATVANTDAVVVQGDSGSDIALDLAGGRFQPGKTAEASDSEIEFTITFEGRGGYVRVNGSANADAITLGQAGSGHESINLNADEATPDFDARIEGTLFPGFEVFGNDGDDLLSGYDDGLFPTRYPSAFDGGPGDDQLVGNIDSTADLEGSSGTDTILFDRQGFDGVTVDLASGTAENQLIDYALANIENVVGSHGLDEISGDDGANILTGGGAFDVFMPRGGDDVIEGNNGFVDTIDLSDSPAPVSIDFGTSTITGDGTDTFEDAEEIIGTPFDDRFAVGYSGPWQDRAEGGPGFDTASYRGSASPVTVSMATGSGTPEGGYSDQLVDIEAVIGSPFADSLNGSDAGEQLVGLSGADYLAGARGPDDLRAGKGRDRVYGGAGVDALRGGPGRDFLHGGAGLDDCAGGLDRDVEKSCEAYR
jgi:Ca2+-binding RTX toxin-like protein